MNQLAKHFWFTFSVLSVRTLHSNEVYSAPVRAYAELQMTILRALEMDPGLQQAAVDFFPNYPDLASGDGTQYDPSVIRNLELRSRAKRSINWNKVIPNRPALAEIVVVGSVSIILALLSGMVLWYFILKRTKEEKELAFGFRLLSKHMPFGNLAQERNRQEEGSAWQRRIDAFKGFDFSALKRKRKRKKDKREKMAKEVKEKQRGKENPPEEMSEKQGEQEKPPGEGKEKREKKPKVAKRQEKQKKSRKVRTTKSKLQLTHSKGKKSPTRKKLK